MVHKIESLRKTIVQHIINSGTNICPKSLDILLNIEDPIDHLKIVLKEASFQPQYKSHITLDVLKQVSNKEIQKALKRIHLAKSNQLLDKDDTTSFHQTQTSESKTQPGKKTQVTTSLNSATVQPNSKIKERPFVKPEPKKKAKKKHSNHPSASQKSVQQKQYKNHGSTKSNLHYQSIAKEYDAEYKVLKDPTGKLFTSGDYEDFYTLTLDKFNKLHGLMKRPASNIINITRNTEKQEVSAAGLVSNIHQTKNGHYFITLEDLTGTVNVLVKNDADNEENFKLAQRTILDQMLYVEGVYSPPDKDRGGRGIIFSNLISKIGIDYNFKPNKSPDPVSLLFLSDLHIGSQEFEEKLWNRFIEFINGRLGGKRERDAASHVKYIIINGDLVDGIGVYPNQENDLVISDIYAQFNKAAELLSGIPDHIKIFFSSGNHEPVRNAIPRPAVDKKYTECFEDIRVKNLGNPSLIQTHNVNTLIFHGDSMIDLNLLIPDLDNDTPVNTMIEMLECRHLAPIFGKKTQVAPTEQDWLVIDNLPDIFHTGHVHINGMGKKANVSLVNSGCFQAQTDFMKSFGIEPTPGIVPIIKLDTLEGIEIDFTK